MNDDELGTALRGALAAPPVTTDRWSGQKLRQRARLRTETRDRRLSALASVVLVVALIGGFFGAVARTGGGSDDAVSLDTGGGGGVAQSADIRLDTPLRIVPVLARTGTACPVPGPAGKVQLGPAGRPTCLTVGPPVLVVTEVTSLSLVPPDSDNRYLRLVVTLVPADAAALVAYSGAHVFEPIAFVVDGTALGAPEIQGPFGTGPFEIAIGDPVTEWAYRALGGK